MGKAAAWAQLPLRSAEGRGAGEEDRPDAEEPEERPLRCRMLLLLRLLSGEDPGVVVWCPARLEDLSSITRSHLSRR